MPSAQDIKAGAAYVELYLKKSMFTRGLNLAKEQLTAMGEFTRRMGARLMAVGGAMTAGFGLATKVFAGFSDEMLKVRAVTSASADEFERLNDLAKELGRTTSYTAAQVGQGMTALGRAGFRPAEIEASIASMLDLARATDTELGPAAEIAAATLRGFRLEADQATRVADVLTAAANSSAQTLMDLGESMKYAAPIAAEAGESLEDTAKALGVMANLGIKGTMAGTALRNMFLQLSNPEVQKSLKNLGIDALDASKNLRPMATILNELAGQMESMGTGERMNLAETLFGRRAIGGALKLTTSPEQMAMLAEAIDNAGGTAAKTAKTMDSGLGGAFRMLKSAAEGIAIAIGEALSDSLQKWMDILREGATRVAKFIDTHKELIIAFGKLSLMVLGVGAGLVVAGSAMVAVGGAAGLAATLITGVASAIGLAGAAIAAIFSPLGVLTAGVVGLGVAMAKHFDAGGKLLGWLGGQFEGLRERATAAWQSIVDAMMAGEFELAARIAFKAVQVEFEKMTMGIHEAWIEFTTEFERALQDIANVLVAAQTRVTTEAKQIWNDIQSLWGGGGGSARALTLGQQEQMRREALRQGLAEEYDRLDTQRRERLDRATKELADAEEELLRLRERAIKETREYNAPARGDAAALGGVRVPTFGMPESELGKTGAVGTFSGYAASILGGPGKLNRMAADQKRTADAVESVDKRMRDGNIVWKK